MLTSDKWRQVRPRDLRTLSRAVHLPQLKSESGSSSSQERRVILQQQAPGEGRHSLCCGLVRVTGQRGKVGWSDASSSAVTGAEPRRVRGTLLFTRDPSETTYGRILETDYGT